MNKRPLFRNPYVHRYFLGYALSKFPKPGKGRSSFREKRTHFNKGKGRGYLYRAPLRGYILQTLICTFARSRYRDQNTLSVRGAEQRARVE